MDHTHHGGHAHAQDQDVGQAEVEQEQVGRVAQIAVLPDDDRHQTVANQAHYQLIDEQATQLSSLSLGIFLTIKKLFFYSLVEDHFNFFSFISVSSKSNIY